MPSARATSAQPLVSPAFVRAQTMRKRANRVMGLMLAYQGVFTGVSIIGGVIIAVVLLGQSMIVGTMLDSSRLQEDMSDSASPWSGVLLIACALASFLFVSLMRRHDVYTREFWLGGPHYDRLGLPMRYGAAPMRPGLLLLLIGLLATLQMGLIFGQYGWSLILGGDGLASPTLDEVNGSAIGAGAVAHVLEAFGAFDGGAFGVGGVGGGATLPVADGADPLAGFNPALAVYVWFVAPVVEEVAFRGVLMYELKPLGRNVAIFSSALVFGMFHDDLVQGMFAFGAGLLFGYVAMEFSVKWSIFLHFMNNGVLVGLVPLLMGFLGPAGDFLYGGGLVVVGLAALFVLVFGCRKRFAAYIRANRSEPGMAKAVWGAPCMIVFIVVNALIIMVSFVGAMAA